jgi:hypothetical protein
LVEPDNENKQSTNSFTLFAYRRTGIEARKTISKMDTYSQAVHESKNYNNYKLTADKVIRILSDVRNERTKSRRRWIWELMQNAKDVPNKFGGVTIEIILRENDFVFSHNGNPFSVANITGLIQQVSAGKPSDSTNKRITGKFGTGFISTHLLSDIVTVSGIVEQEGLQPKKFELELNRKSEKSEELIGFIADELEKLEQIDKEEFFPTVFDYENRRTEDSFDSKFIYPLETLESKEAAKVGIEDLAITMPQTLFFVDELKKVIIKNEVENKTTVYELCSIHADDLNANYSYPYVKRTVNGVVEDFYFIRYRDEHLDLAVRVNNHFDKELGYIPKAPRLFRDFPLVGTESFIFPFILNGFNFFPTEKRDNILLTDTTSGSVITNRSIIVHAVEKSKEFVAWLINNGAKNFSYAAQSRIPTCLIETEVKDWYKANIQKPYRQFVVNQEIVETSGSKKRIGEALIPKFSGTKEANEQFWELLKDYCGSDAVCKKEHLELWQENLGPESEIETWGQKIFYKIEDLLFEIQSKQTIGNISLKNSDLSNINWLNAVYQFLIENKLNDCFKTYKIIPTISGTLKSFNDTLFIEKETKIPDEFISIFKEMKHEDWNDILIHRELITIDSSRSSKTVKDISDEINKILNNEDKDYSGKVLKSFIDNTFAETILLRILRITNSQSDDTFQTKLFNLARAFLNSNEQQTVIPGIGDFNFSPAKRQLIKLLNKKIEEKASLTLLGMENAEEWLLGYLLLLQGSSEFKSLLEYGRIIPNRNNELRLFKDVYGYGTEDIPLFDDLINILADLNSNKNWNDFLIHDAFRSVVLPPKKLDELSNSIWEELEKLRLDNSFSSKSKAILDLIKWCSSHFEAQKYFAAFMNQKDKIFVEISLEDDVVGDNIVKLLSNKEMLPQLVEIAEIAETIGIETVKNLALQVKEKQEDFEFKKKIGEAVEKAFIEAFNSLNLPYTITYQGIGSQDVIISNPLNNKSFYIELKSLSPTNWDKSLKLAVSQAKKAVEQMQEGNYVVSVLVRPDNWEMATVDYIKTNLNNQFNTGNLVEAAKEKNDEFERLMASTDEIKLEFDNTDRKVVVPESIWRSNGNQFSVLIERLKQYLG